MESAETKIVIDTTIISLEERHRDRWVTGVGPDALFKSYTLGWFVVFQGSREALYVGETKPAWQRGDQVKIIFEKVSK